MTGSQIDSDIACHNGEGPGNVALVLSFPWVLDANCSPLYGEMVKKCSTSVHWLGHNIHWAGTSILLDRYLTTCHFGVFLWIPLCTPSLLRMANMSCLWNRNVAYYLPLTSLIQRVLSRP